MGLATKATLIISLKTHLMGVLEKDVRSLSLFSLFNEQCGASGSHKIKGSFYPTKKNYFNIMSDNEMQKHFNRDSFIHSPKESGY